MKDAIKKVTEGTHLTEKEEIGRASCRERV